MCVAIEVQAIFRIAINTFNNWFWFKNGLWVGTSFKGIKFKNLFPKKETIYHNPILPIDWLYAFPLPYKANNLNIFPPHLIAPWLETIRNQTSSKSFKQVPFERCVCILGTFPLHHPAVDVPGRNHHFSSREKTHKKHTSAFYWHASASQPDLSPREQWWTKTLGNKKKDNAPDKVWGILHPLSHLGGAHAKR